MMKDRVDNVILTFLDSEGQPCGVSLRISCIPTKDPDRQFTIWNLSDSIDAEPDSEPIRVLEGEEYRYQVLAPGSMRVVANPSELFMPDDHSGRSGRFRPGLNTGTITIDMGTATGPVGTARLECVSRKLDYGTEYRWMLRDIADVGAEIISERFAAASQTFAPEATRDPATLYQRFAFLKSLISGAEFEGAIRQVLRAPHRVWITQEGEQSIFRGISPSSRCFRSITGPGPRVTWAASSIPRLGSLPVKSPVFRSVEQLDNAENRLIKAILLSWRQTAAEIASGLAAQVTVPAVDRGVREANYVVDKLDSVLHEELFREVGDMEFFPSASQVLIRKPGYRELFHAYLQGETAAQLAWPGGDDIYAAGKRNVAVLYELWVFFALSRIVAKFCDGTPLDIHKFIVPTRDGFSLTIRRGKRLVFQGSTERLGRKLQLQLFFNRGFWPSNNLTACSWTRIMRPDYSLHVLPELRIGDIPESAWIHFDAKYRVNALTEILGEEQASSVPEAGLDDVEGDDLARLTERSYLREDLLKMHAYKDAVRRTVGAYILYPGDEEKTFGELLEILPGLGAFPFAPTQDGDPKGGLRLASFIDQILEHMAWQASSDSRLRYWSALSAAGSGHLIRPTSLYRTARPPADTLVAIIRTRSAECWKWILANRIAIPANATTPGVTITRCEFVLIVGLQKLLELRRVEGVRAISAAELRALGYPAEPPSVAMVLELSGTSIDTSAIEVEFARDGDAILLADLLRRDEGIALRPWIPPSPNDQLVFAYGSNLDSEQIASRCPTSRLLWFRAVATGWKLCFSRYSHTHKGGVASMRREPDSRVRGVVQSIAANDLSKLDAREGVPTSYTRTKIEVTDEQDREHEVWVYIANTVDPVRHCTPSDSYLATILKGLKQCEFDINYIAEVQAIAKTNSGDSQLPRIHESSS